MGEKCVKIVEYVIDIISLKIRDNRYRSLTKKSLFCWAIIQVNVGHQSMAPLFIPEDPCPRTGPSTGVLGNGKRTQYQARIGINNNMVLIIGGDRFQDTYVRITVTLTVYSEYPSYMSCSTSLSSCSSRDTRVRI